jgi:chromosome segregation ATPase
MFDDFDFDATQGRLQEHRVNLARLAEIQDELRTLINARDRLLKDLTSLKATLEAHRQAGSAIRLRAMQILTRLAKQVDEGVNENQGLSSDDERLISDLDASRIQLEHDVDLTERRLKIAHFEADSLAEMLEDLEDQVAEIAADLDREKDSYLNERN